MLFENRCKITQFLPLNLLLFLIFIAFVHLSANFNDC